VQENTTLFGQMADPLIVLVHWVVKLSFSNRFFPDQWLPYVLINMISTKADAKANIFMLHGYQATFCIILLHFSFSFQLWALAMKTTVVSQRE